MDFYDLFFSVFSLDLVSIEKICRPTLETVFDHIFPPRISFTIYLFIYLFCHTTNIMKTVKEKIERMDLTMARRPKGNYEAYIN